MPKCDICNRKFKYKEVYISAVIDGELTINECLNCAEEHEDDNEHEGVQWAVLIK